MADYEIIDAHVHTYQTREMGLTAKQGSTVTDYAGTPDELMAVMKKAGISRAVMVNVLPVTDMRQASQAKLPAGLSATENQRALQEIDTRLIGRLERRNAWACSAAKENSCLTPFLNLDPLMDEPTIVNEIKDKIKQGAGGVKLHPAVQRFFPNNHQLWPVYRTAQQLDLPVISHGGVFATSVPYAQPKNFIEVLTTFPHLNLVMAHLGMGYFDETVFLAATFRNVCFDCSAIISHTEAEGGLSDNELTALIKRIGVERVMFGSDFPWLDPIQAVNRFVGLDFTSQEKQQILAENARRIYRLP